MKVKENEFKETRIWQGEDTFDKFAYVFSVLGYRYAIKCTSFEEGDEVELGAACRNKKELLEMVFEFSEKGFSSWIMKIDKATLEQHCKEY